MSFKFIGGSSLQGPINRLQNAVSYNFFANTEIYNDNADQIKVSNDPNKLGTIVNGYKPNNYDLPESDNSNASVNNGKNLEVDQEAEAENENNNSPEELIVSDDKLIKNFLISCKVSMDDGGTITLNGTGQFSQLSKPYPCKFGILIDGKKVDIGIGNISSDIEKLTITSDKEWRYELLRNNVDGDKVAFQIAVNVDDEWLRYSFWVTRIMAGYDCWNTDTIMGDLLTTSQFDEYKVKVDAMTCDD